jgi:hypothetical protein
MLLRISKSPMDGLINYAPNAFWDSCRDSTLADILREFNIFDNLDHRPSTIDHVMARTESITSDPDASLGGCSIT